MSIGERIPFARAMDLANNFERLVHSAETCTRFEFAGSLRRKKPDIGDFDIVAIPHIKEVPADDMFGTPTRTNLLWWRLDELVHDGTCSKHVKQTTAGPRTKWGEKSRAIEYMGVAFEITLADADNFGVRLAIQTGPADLSHDLVTRAGRLKGIRFTGDFHVETVGNGVAAALIPLPEEELFFKLVGRAFVPPAQRV